MKLMSKNGNAEYPGNHRGRLYPTHIHASPVYGTGDPRGPYTGRYFSEGASEADGTKGTRKGPDPAPNHPCLSIHRKFSKNPTRESHHGRYPKHIARGAKCWGSLLHACRLFGLNAVGSLLFIHKSFHEAAAHQHCQGWPAVFEGRELFGFAGSVADRHF